MARAVDADRRIEAGVAIAAGFDVLVEIGQQRLAPALRRLAIGEQRIEALVFAQLVLGVIAVVVDEHAAHADVVEPVEHQRFGRQAVASGAADLLIIGLDAAGQVEVADKAMSGLSMPMPKAMVATMTTAFSLMNRSCPALRKSASWPA